MGWTLFLWIQKKLKWNSKTSLSNTSNSFLPLFSLMWLSQIDSVSSSVSYVSAVTTCVITSLHVSRSLGVNDKDYEDRFWFWRFRKCSSSSLFVSQSHCLHSATRSFISWFISSCEGWVISDLSESESEALGEGQDIWCAETCGRVRKLRCWCASLTAEPTEESPSTFIYIINIKMITGLVQLDFLHDAYQT